MVMGWPPDDVDWQFEADERQRIQDSDHAYTELHCCRPPPAWAEEMPHTLADYPAAPPAPKEEETHG